MTKLALLAVVALAGAGCQAQTPLPAQAPQGGAMAAAPSAPPGPEMMAHHHEGAGGPAGHEEGCDECEHDDDGPADRMARHEHHGERGDDRRMGPGGHEEMEGAAALGVHFYSPEMLIGHAQVIGLTSDQVAKIRQEMVSTRARAIDLHAKLQHAEVEVSRLLAAEKVDERALGVQFDEAAKAEAELHKLHLGMMLRVRALLTPEQRQKLEEHESRHEGPKAAILEGQGGAMGDADDDEDDDG